MGIHRNKFRSGSLFSSCPSFHILSQINVMENYSYVFQKSLNAIPFVITLLQGPQIKTMQASEKYSFFNNSISTFFAWSGFKDQKCFIRFLSDVPDVLYPLFVHLDRTPVSVFRHLLQMFQQFLLLLKFLDNFNDKLQDISVNIFVLHSTSFVRSDGNHSCVFTSPSFSFIKTLH